MLKISSRSDVKRRSFEDGRPNKEEENDDDE